MLYDELKLGERVKIGCVDGYGFIFCGIFNLDNMDKLKSFFCREVVKIYESAHGGRIILIIGNEKTPLFDYDDIEDMVPEDLFEDKCKNLICAIYEVAVDDYMRAFVKRDIYSIQSLQKFMKSGYLWMNPQTGEYIIKKIQDEIILAKEYIAKFKTSGKKIDQIPKTVLIKAVRLLAERDSDIYVFTDKHGIVFLEKRIHAARKGLLHER